MREKFSHEKRKGKNSMKTISVLSVCGLAVCTAFAEEAKQDEPTIAVEVRFIMTTNGKGLKGVDVFSPKHLYSNSVLRVETKSGQRGTNKCVQEYIYPKDFNLMFSTNKLDNIKATAEFVFGPIVEPIDFITQEVGTFVDVTPTWNPEDNTIDLDITPSIVEVPVWHGSRYVDANTGEAIRDGKWYIELPMERPHFPVLKVSTKRKLQDGDHTIFGGFRDVSGTKKRIFYFVIKASVVKSPE
jgi:hypothetical protein